MISSTELKELLLWSVVVLVACQCGNVLHFICLSGAHLFNHIKARETAAALPFASPPLPPSVTHGSLRSRAATPAESSKTWCRTRTSDPLNPTVRTVISKTKMQHLTKNKDHRVELPPDLEAKYD